MKPRNALVVFGACALLILTMFLGERLGGAIRDHVNPVPSPTVDMSVPCSLPGVVPAECAGLGLWPTCEYEDGADHPNGCLWLDSSGALYFIDHNVSEEN